VSFAGREEQEFLEKTRLAQQSSEWQNLYRERAGIEGTISQSVRGYGLRQTRYIGKRVSGRIVRKYTLSV
jgi:transposase